jgi:uncharacterized membrane protein YcjF (UPF0283 family)
MSSERYTYYRFCALTFGTVTFLRPWLPTSWSALGWLAWGGLVLLLLPVVACAISDREMRRQAQLSNRDQEGRGPSASSAPSTPASPAGVTQRLEPEERADP